MKNNKLLVILTNILNRNSTVVVNFIISFIVIKLTTVTLWGEFVYYMTLVHIIGVLVSWGSKDYLLKEFSLNPKNIINMWNENFFTRFVFLLVPIALATIFLFPSEISILLCLWILIQFINKSYEVFIYYYRSFGFSLLVEFINLLALILLISLNKDYLNIFYLLIFNLVSGIMRVIMYSIYFQINYKFFLNMKFNLNEFKYSLSFFFLALVGILNSRVDIFCINYTMNKSDLGNYQVFLSFLFLIQNIGHLFLEPFAKNLYRMNDSAVLKIKWLLGAVGPFVSFVLIVFAYFIITYGYGIFLSQWVYIIGFFFCLPVFIYALKVYKLFKFDNQHWVIYISAICLILNVMLDLNTIQYWGLTGVIFSGMIVQWIKLLLFIIVDNFVSIKSQSRSVPV